MRRNVLLHVLKRKAAIRQDITIRGAHTSLIRGNHTYSHTETDTLFPPRCFLIQDIKQM